VPRATGTGTHLSRYEEAWEAINRLIRRGGSWSGHERNCFFVQGPSGRFENASAVHGLDAPEDGRGLAILDFDRDGDPDMIVKNRNAPQLRLWRNDFTSPGNRIQVHLRGGGQNLFAVGAQVTIAAGGRTRVKEVCAGSGFLSQSSPVLHFGLGAATRVERLEVRWPSGKRTRHQDLPVNRRYVVAEDGAAPVIQEFARGRELPGAPTPQEPQPQRAAVSFWLVDPTPLPPLTLRDAHGAPVSLADVPASRPRLISFWDADCPRCEAETAEWTLTAGGSAAATGPFVVLLSTARQGTPPDGARLARSPFPRAFIGEADALALGILLEEIGHWPREIPVPASLLLDGGGRIVKVYRGAASWSQIAADASALPATEEERLRRAVPFAGRYHATELHRNDFQLGVSYLEAGLADHALAAFERTLSRQPDQPDAHYNIGVILQRRGDPAGARARYLEALELQPDFVDARANLGVIAAEAGRFDEAAAELEHVLELRPDHTEALIDLGNVELARGRPGAAIEVYSRAIAQEPQLVPARKKLGDALRRLGDTENARRAYEEAVRLAPRDAEAWSNLGVLHAEIGQLEAALRHCDRAIELDPAYAPAQNNAGLILEGLGRPEEALRRFERAIEIQPGLAPPYLNLARRLLRQGEEQRARKVLDRLLEVHPGHAGAQELLRRLQGR
jgi:tetratricopeptide (TPR) repeat protein